MVFSAGNVLVLFIVLVILAIYRQLDRNNRSLEKVKRFAERVQGDLDALVEQKATAIKDMGIELEVHQRAAREVLKRIQTLEDGLSKRAEQIEKIGNRIGDYDTALDELLKMTGRAQENITRIKDESEYIDTVGKRLKLSQTRMDEIGARIPELVTEFARHNAGELEKLEESVFRRADERIHALTESLDSVAYRLNEFEESVATARAAGDEVTAGAISDLERAAEKTVERLVSKGEEAQKAIERYAGRFSKVEQDYESRLEKIAARGEKMETAALEKLKDHIKNRVQGVSEELSRTIAEQHKEAEARIKEVRLLINNGGAAMKSWETELATVGKHVTDEMQALRDRLAGSTQEIEQQVLAAVEARIHEFEDAISYRVQKIEGVTSDIDALEAALRQSMQAAEERVSSEFDQFGADLMQQRETDRTAAEASFSALRDEMAGLEQGLNELKQRAYENVSEKLQGFEDEFFTDLRDRSVAIEGRLDEFQTDLRMRLAEMEERYAAERESVEVGYRDQLRTRLSEHQQTVQTRLESISRKAESLENELGVRFAEWEQSVDGFREHAAIELQAAGEGARARFDEELERRAAAIASQVESLERGVAGRVQELDQSVSARIQEVSTRIDETQSEAALAQAKLEQQIAATTDELDQQIGDFRRQVAAEMAEFSTEIRDKRDRLAIQVGELEDRLSTVRSDMDSRVDEVLVRFKSQYDDLERHLGARASEIQDQSEEISREITALVQQTREQFSGMQQKLLGRLQDETRVISVNLEEIDKRQKQFVEQTRIFERADTLKVALEQNVDHLKTEIGRVEQMRSEVRELDGQVGRLRKAAGEAAEKMARFVAEKRRIDALEDDFRRLIGMSQTIETRLEQVTASNDEVQAIQAQLRNLEQMQKETEENFGRLEKKRSILDVTTDGIDKSFQQLQQLEKRLETVDERLTTVPRRLDEVTHTMHDLLSGKKETEAAVKQLGNLDTVLKDIEGRMEQLSTAREWLARTETRLEEVGREAQEQVKLLGTLLRDNGKGEKPEKGAPTLSARDTVVKLARQGWKVEEISRATKVSRGEVELILELAGNH